MADINFVSRPAHKLASTKADGSTPPKGVSGSVPYELIELLFFAYREFTSDPDDVLAQYGFGRAHHRVLHFVDRHPGIMVTDLLGILKITKQSLGRVLKQLVDEDFIEQRPGAIDRRQRLLHTTSKGHDLARRLALLQTERLDRAIKDLPNGATDAVKQFLFQMIDPEARSEVANLINVRHDETGTSSDKTSSAP